MADERYNVIGVVRGKGEKVTTPKDGGEGKAFAEVQIEDINGMKVTWTTFHVTIAQPLQLGKWYEFEVATPSKKEGGGVWHNLEKVIRGPIDKPVVGTQGGEAAVAATGPAHTVKSDAQFKIERTSLQRQGALGIVTRLIEHGIGVEELGGVVDRLLEEAVKVEAFYERAIDQPAAPAKREARKANPKVDAATGPSEAEVSVSDEDTAKDAEVEALGAPRDELERVPVFSTTGQLMMKVTSTWRGKTSGDLCEIVGVKKPVEIEDLDAAWAKAVEAWGEPVEVAA